MRGLEEDIYATISATITSTTLLVRRRGEDVIFLRKNEKIKTINLSGNYC